MLRNQCDAAVLGACHGVNHFEDNVAGNKELLAKQLFDVDEHRRIEVERMYKAAKLAEKENAGMVVTSLEGFAQMFKKARDTDNTVSFSAETTVALAYTASSSSSSSASSSSSSSSSSSTSLEYSQPIPESSRSSALNALKAELSSVHSLHLRVAGPTDMCDVVCGPVEEGSEAERLGVKEGDGIAAVNGNRSVKSIGAIELLAATPPFVVTLLRMRGGGGEDTNQEARSGNKGGKNGGAGGEASGLISSAATEGGEGTMDAMRDVSASRGPPVAVVRQSSVLVDVSVGFGMETSDSNDPMMGGARITRIIYEDGVKLQAEQLGLQCDDCIYEIGGERVKSNKDFARLLRAAAEKAAAEDDKEGEHEEEDEHSRAVLEDESLSLSLSLFVVGRPQNLLPCVLYIRERYTR